MGFELGLSDVVYKAALRVKSMEPSTRQRVWCLRDLRV